MTKMMTLRIDVDLLARLKNQAKREGRSASAEVVTLLRREFGGEKKPKKPRRDTMGMFGHLESVRLEDVRELRNLIERAVILAPEGGGVLSPDLLPPRIAESALRQHMVAASLPGAPGAGLTVTFEPGRDTLENLERRLLEEALRMSGGKKNRAAEILGISRFALLRRVEKYGLG